MNRRPNGATTLYVVATKDGFYVKIGITNNLPRRLQQLQSSSPVLLSVLAAKEFPTRQGATLKEAFTLTYFRQWRVEGEWLQGAPIEKVVDYIHQPLRNSRGEALT